MRRNRGERRRRRRSPYVLVVELIWFGVLLGYPLLFSSFGPSFGQRLVVLSLLALSLDLVWGVSGIFCLGQAGFFAAGAYTVALLNTDHDLTNGIVLVLAAVGVAGLLALLLGLFLFGSREEVGTWYVALATLAFSYATQKFIQATQWLGSDSGIFGIFGIDLAPITGGSPEQTYYALLGVLVIVYVAAVLFTRSKWGIRLSAIRDDAERMRYLGYRVNNYRVIVFVAGASIAGLAGALLAITQSFVTPTLAGVEQSTETVIAMILGGPGFLIGAVLGSGVYSIAEFKLSEAYPAEWQIGLGVALVAFIVLVPRGLVGSLERLFSYSAGVLGRLRTGSATGADDATVGRDSTGEPSRPSGAAEPPIGDRDAPPGASTEGERLLSGRSKSASNSNLPAEGPVE